MSAERGRFVSVEGAARDYGVVIDPKGLIVDASATDKRRRRAAATEKTKAAHKPPRRQVARKRTTK